MPPQLSPQAGIDSADYDTSRDVINHAAELLSVPRSDLDHSIWKYMGDQRSPACK
jgi:hypothetical protein